MSKKAYIYSFLSSERSKEPSHVVRAQQSQSNNQINKDSSPCSEMTIFKTFGDTFFLI